MLRKDSQTVIFFAISETSGFTTATATIVVQHTLDKQFRSNADKHIVQVIFRCQNSVRSGRLI